MGMVPDGDAQRQGVLGTKDFAAPYCNPVNTVLPLVVPRHRVTLQSLKTEACFLWIFPGLPGALF